MRMCRHDNRLEDGKCPICMTPHDAKRMTSEEMWTRFTSEGGDYARTQYPLFKEIIEQAYEKGFAEAKEKAEIVLDHYWDSLSFKGIGEKHGKSIAEMIRALEKDKPQ